MRVRIRRIPSAYKGFQYWHVEYKHWWNLSWKYYESTPDEKEAVRCAQELVCPTIVEFKQIGMASLQTKQTREAA